MNILIIKHGALGDLIQADGVLKDIRAHYPQAHLTLLTAPAYINLMQRCPYIDHVLSDDRPSFWQLHKLIKLIKQLKSKHFSLVIDLQNSDRSRLYQTLIFRHTPWIGRAKHITITSGLDGLITLLNENGIPSLQALEPNVSWMCADIDHLLPKTYLSQPYIALIPGCSAQHPQKRWPYFTDLADELIARGYRVVNILGPDELDMGHTLPGYTPMLEHGVVNLFELAGLLEHASYIIGNDTGPAHIAACLNRPGVALFGSYSSADRAAIKRHQFEAIEVTDLNRLSVEHVLTHMLPKLPAPNPHPATQELPPNY
jgi:ADP-heptose:LPS heptosyltransferase